MQNKRLRLIAGALYDKVLMVDVGRHLIVDHRVTLLSGTFVIFVLAGRLLNSQHLEAQAQEQTDPVGSPSGMSCKSPSQASGPSPAAKRIS
eukprot:scaffold7979_cov417-Prasinococcus_capsulatus_cf.AAC.6